MGLSTQYSFALFLKAFATTDATMTLQRDDLFNACIATLTQEWQFVVQAPAENQAALEQKAMGPQA